MFNITKKWLAPAAITVSTLALLLLLVFYPTKTRIAKDNLNREVYSMVDRRFNGSRSYAAHTILAVRQQRNPGFLSFAVRTHFENGQSMKNFVSCETIQGGGCYYE